MSTRDGKNRLPKLRIPPGAGLEEIVDWRHPLLAGLREPDPAARLLAAWRRKQGYAYFFDRQDIPAVLRDIPEDNWRDYRQCLNFFDPDRRAAWKGAPPIPVRRVGRVDWNYATPDHRELVCHTNRFSWMVGLAAAIRRDAPDKAGIVFDIMDDWIRLHPLPEDKLSGTAGTLWYKPWGPLQAALRLKHWMLALHLLWDSPALTARRFGRYVVSIRQHAVWLSQISPRLWAKADHNHFLMESEGLLYGALLPWLREARVLRETAVHNLARCARKQVLPDGVHVERAPAYHNGCIQWFALPLLLCRLNRLPVPADVFRRVLPMLDFVMTMRAPEGWVHRFEDTFSGRDGYQSELLIFRLTGRKLPVKGLRPAGLIAFVRNVVRGKGSGDAKWSTARRFPHGGFAVARTGWGPRASMLAVKLEGHGGGHAHADYLSFCFSWRGRTIVDERGTLGYNESREAVACKLAAAHNVLLLGDRDMHAVGNPEKYWERRPAVVRVEDVFFKPLRGARALAGGRVIWPDGACWSREIEFSPKNGLVVRDRIRSSGAEPVRIQFFLPSTRVRRSGPAAFRTADPGLPNVEISCAGSPGVRGAAAPSCIYDMGPSHPATRLTFESPAATEGAWETVIRGDRR